MEIKYKQCLIRSVPQGKDIVYNTCSGHVTELMIEHTVTVVNTSSHEGC